MRPATMNVRDPDLPYNDPEPPNHKVRYEFHDYEQQNLPTHRRPRCCVKRRAQTPIMPKAMLRLAVELPAKAISETSSYIIGPPTFGVCIMNN
jgi:hypothetical protein